MPFPTGGPGTHIDTFAVNVSHPKAEGYNVRVGNRWYRTIAGPEVPIQIGTRDSLAERQDRAGSIYENVLDIGYAWARTDLSGGEGLDWDPRELALDQDQAALDKIRYWDSNGISIRRPNTAGEQYTLRLARTLNEWSPDFVELRDMADSDNFIFIADGPTVFWYESWANTTPVGEDTLPSPVKALAASPNDTVLAVLDDGDVWAKRPSEPDFIQAYNATDPGNPLLFEGNWDYDTPNTTVDPLDGECIHAKDEKEVMRFALIDNDAVDRTIELKSVLVGDNIQFDYPAGTEYTVQDIVVSDTYISFVVIPAEVSAPKGVTAFGFLSTRLPAQGIWYVHGRFIMSTWDDAADDSSELRTIEWTGDEWATHLNLLDTASAPFWSVVESGPAVVAACGDGTVRTYTPEQDGTMELLPRSRTTMPEGESAILLGSNASVLIIMTSSDQSADDRQILRVYQAEVLDSRYDFTVGQMQLRREWQGVEHEPLVTRNMSNSRDEIFWFVKELLDGVFQESLWRFDIVTNGLNRVTSEAGVNFNALISFDSVIAGIDFAANKIAVGDTAHRQTFGYMIFPNITFGLNTDITWLSSIMEAFSLVETGAQVELWRSHDPEAILDWQDSSWVLMQRISSEGGSNVEIPLVNLKSRTLSLQLRMYAAEEQSISPQVSRIAIRGIPAHRDLIMQVPFNISDYVSANGRTPIRVPGLGDSLHNQVFDLVGKSVEVVVLDPPMGFRGIVNNVSEPIEYLADRGSSTRYVMVEFRGQRLTATAVPTGDTGMGLGLLGISTVGIGQTQTT